MECKSRLANLGQPQQQLYAAWFHGSQENQADHLGQAHAHGQDLALQQGREFASRGTRWAFSVRVCCILTSLD